MGYILHDSLDQWFAEHIAFVFACGMVLGASLCLIGVHTALLKAYLDGIEKGEQRGFDRANKRREETTECSQSQ